MTTYNYLVQLNGKGVKKGMVTFKNETDEEVFIQKMEKKYKRTDDDWVGVMFR